MNRYFKRQGSEVVEKISDSRTASPNLWWTPEQMTAHGFTECQADAQTLLAEKCKAFDYMLFEGRIIQVLAPERWFQLSVSTGIAYTMNRLIEYPGREIANFQRFKAFIEGLGQGGSPILTSDEIAQIKALFVEQGINLDQLEV